MYYDLYSSEITNYFNNFKKLDKDIKNDAIEWNINKYNKEILNNFIKNKKLTTDEDGWWLIL